MTRYYIIRHKATGKLMPALRGRGATAWEPTFQQEKLHSARNVPRLYARKADASNSVRWWAEGEWVNDHEDGLPILRRVVDRGRTFRKRNADELEILEVELKVVGQLELAL